MAEHAIRLDQMLPVLFLFVPRCFFLVIAVVCGCGYCVGVTCQTRDAVSFLEPVVFVRSDVGNAMLLRTGYGVNSSSPRSTTALCCVSLFSCRRGLWL